MILAQSERWRHALHMQVERESDFGREYSGGRVRITWITCLKDRDNLGKPKLIPDMTTMSEDIEVKDGRLRLSPFEGSTSYQVVGGVKAYQAKDG